MFRRSIACVILVLLLGASDTKLHFISPDSVDVLQLLPDPPDKNSDEANHEMDLILKIQATRTDAQVARGVSEAKFTVFAFSDVLGSWFTAENCPQTAQFFKDIESDSKNFTKIGKDHWNRLRPEHVNSPVIPEKGGSYPSGHSTRGTIYAEILAEIFPQNRDALLARGRQIGWDRVIVGAHFPSDIYAGRVLGHALAREFLANPEVRAQLQKIKTELEEHAVHTSAAAQ